MQSEHDFKIETDVAIIGGGTAGVNSAMAAAEMGLEVLVVDKANINRSGAIAGGIDHFMAFLETGEPWDTREAWLKYVGRVAKGAVNLKIHDAVLCEELNAAIERVERLGIALRDPGSGKFFRTQALGQPGPYAINFNGKRLKPAMAEEVRRLGCRVLDRVQVTNLFLNDGELAGFTGFDMRTGDFYQIRAKAVIISTGNTNRMFRSQTANPFNLWYCPACTGDLHRQAFDAGVELANMEYVRMTIVPKGFSAPGFNAFFGMGSRLINSLGETFMESVHPMGDRAPRNYMVWGALQELREGRGPIYMDCGHLTQKQREHLFTTLGYDKDTLPDFFIKKGYNLEGTMIEMTVSEPMQARPSEVSGNDIKIDEKCASIIPGLYAAGDTSLVARGHLSGAFVFGEISAESATGYAAKAEAVELDRDQVSAFMTKRDAKLEQSGNLVPVEEFEYKVRRIINDYIVPPKNEYKLNNALWWMDRFRKELIELVRIRDIHDLFKAYEVENIIQCATMSATASRERKESRWGMWHFRHDYPDVNDREWMKHIVLSRGEAPEDIKISQKEIIKM